MSSQTQLLDITEIEGLLPSTTTSSQTNGSTIVGLSSCENGKDDNDNPLSYSCDNISCRQSQQSMTSVYVFNVNQEYTVNICDNCYNNGFRVDVFDHKVYHMTQMDKLTEDGAYSLSENHKQQVSQQRLQHITDLTMYFEQIGLSTLFPCYEVVNLN